MVFRWVVFAWHLATFATYALGIFVDVFHVHIPVFDNRNFGGKWKYLTFLNMVVQAVFFGIAVVCDCQIILQNVSHTEVVINKKVRTNMIKIRDFIFTVVGFPIALFVFATFWGLYAIDRELIFPPFLEQFIPAWLNHIMHTVILPTALIELMLIPHQYSPKSTALPSLIILMALYIVWTLVVAYVGQVWTYPILAVLNWWQLIMFFAGSTGIVLSLYFLGEKLHKKSWGSLGTDSRKAN